jgi:hypothetical protein
VVKRPVDEIAIRLDVVEAFIFILVGVHSRSPGVAGSGGLLELYRILLVRSPAWGKNIPKSRKKRSAVSRSALDFP